MAYVSSNGLRMCVEEFGPGDGRPLLMVAGFTAQLISWDPDFLAALTSAGFRVITFDNRDAGRSQRLDGVESNLGPIVHSALSGSTDFSDEAMPPYRIADMAMDAAGVLDALDLESAHVFGMSMGGMISQALAISCPDRVRTLTSVMSTTSEPEVSRPTPEAQTMLLRPPPVGREATIASYIESGRVTGSKTLFDEDAVAARAVREFERGLYPEGSARQLAAILGSGHRVDGLETCEVPTLVIHGTDDTLIPVEAGVRTAEVMPNAELLIVEQMGHDLPRPLWGTIVGAVDAFTRKHDAAALVGG